MYVGTFKVEFSQSEYVVYENDGSVCIGLTLINQSSFDYNITVEFSNVDSNTSYNGYATGMYVVVIVHMCMYNVFSHNIEYITLNA